MPRPENPLDPEAGPIAAFAVQLRRLRVDAGKPSYRVMAKRSYYGYTTLAGAAAGHEFPSWEVTRAYVTACDGDLDEWERRWRATAARVNHPGNRNGDRNGDKNGVPPRRVPPPSPAPRLWPATVDPARAMTWPELLGMLDELRSHAGLSLRQLVDRSREDADGYVLARTSLSEFLQGMRPPRARDLLRIVELCGVSPSELQRWATACDRLIDPTDDHGAVIRPPRPTEGTFARPGERDPASGSMVPRLLLGARLRVLREACGIPPQEAGYVIRASHSKISRMELGRVRFKERDVADLLTLYGVRDPAEREPLLALARQTSAPRWWQRYGDVLPSWFEVYLGMEEAASSLRTYELQFVPGLLQTEDYARAVIRLGYPFASADEVERRVQVRTIRQWRVASEERLTKEGGPKLRAVLDEGVLRRPIGDRTVMRAQIEHLIETFELPGISLRILPFSAAMHTAAGSFTILRFDDPSLADVVYLEQLASANYLDRPDDVELYERVWSDYTAASRPETTGRLLRGLLRDI